MSRTPRKRRRLHGLRPDRLMRWYGARPAHLLAMACCFAPAGYAAVGLLTGRTLAVAFWFVAAALLHDLVLLPLYAGADLTAQTALAPGPGRPRAVPLLNHLRVPAFLSALLLLVWFPLILDLSEPYQGATALPESVYLSRWLLVTAALFAASSALLTARLLRLRHRNRPRRRGKPPKDPAPASPECGT